MSIKSHNEMFHCDFCPICGGLIDLDTLDSVITCQVCKNKLPFTEFIGTNIKTSLQIKTNKEWLHKYDPTRSLKEKRAKSKMITKEKCPKCDNPEMKYYIAQIRSADQGSTVFYECQKCNHTFSVNN